MPHAIPGTTGQSDGVSARDAARSLGVSERTIRRAIACGELVAIKKGRAFQITPEALDLYLALRVRNGRRRTPTDAGRVNQLGSLPVFTVLKRRAPPSPDALPAPLNRFIGREREVTGLAGLLREDDTRLVTLTGPGGVGKTRLALRVAELIADDFIDGVAFVPLAAVDHPDLVLATVARALKVRESSDLTLAENLATALHNRHLLLVLDNFEHLTIAATALADLLTNCSRLTLLVTSRGPLRLSGERHLPTSPLALPGLGEQPALSQLSTYEAIMLFVERAQQVRPDFSLDETNAAPVLEICRRLDGLPLALELAAARLRILTPAALVARLERRLPLLTGGAADQPARLRTMRDAISWSHDLLSDDERRFFRRLGVFVGGFTLDEVEGSFWNAGGVGNSDPPSVIDLVTGLVDKSLVQQMDSTTAEPRFRMLETVREFALERLAASGEDAPARAAHAAHFLTLAEEAANAAERVGSGDWMRRLTAERPNLRAALDWFERTGSASAALQMTGALWHYWYRLGDMGEGRTRLERALAAAPTEPELVFRARALRGAGVLAWQSADYDGSRNRLESALADYRALGDRAGAAWVLNSLGCLCATLSDTKRADDYLNQALAIFRELGDVVGIAQLTANLGELAESTSHHDLAIARLEEAIARWHALDDRVGAARAQVILSHAFLARDQVPRAAGVLREALITIRDNDYEQILPAALRSAAQLAVRRGEGAAAARWYGAEDGVRNMIGVAVPAARRRGYERHLDSVRQMLGTKAFATAWSAGRSLSAAQALTEVLADAEQVAGEGLTLGATGLSPREREVLRLVAAGHSDKEIADALFITRRTASKHVSSILAKLEVETRTSAVASAIHLGLV